MVAAMGLVLAGFCADHPSGMIVLPCPESAPGTSACNPSKKELKAAKIAFVKGMRLQNAKRNDEALEEFEAAARLSPHNIDYLTAREMARQQLVFDHLQNGNANLLKGQQVEALAEFRSAMNLDPENEFAQQRLRDAMGEWAPQVPVQPEILEDDGEVRVMPNDGKLDFHFRGDGRALITQVAAAYGVVASFDDSVVPRRVHFDIDQVDFFTAIRAACDATRTFWAPLAEKQILLASESPENHRQFDRMSLRTFYVPGATSPTDLTDIVNTLRTLFEIRFVTPQPQAGTVVVRAPQNVLDAATKFITGLGDNRPQVMLDVSVYEVSHTLTRNMGLHIPNQFQLFNIPAGALAALGGQNIQDLINQLISGGGINQANSQSLSALLAQLGGQQNSIFSQPLATFGGGLTLMGLSLGTASAQLSINESTVKTLEHATIRVAQGNEGSFRMGTRFPILNASFAPVFNSAAISQVLQNNTFQAPFPSFNYEDIGLTLKAKPLVSGNLDVNLALEMQFRTLGGQSFNGVPVISNREYKGSIVLMDGEPAVVAGAITNTDTRSLNGIPGLGAVPGLNKVMTTNSKEEDDDELLVVITPHVLSRSFGNQTAIWMAK
jgi:tetratricopeptide (TPR) repeat protein